MNALTFRGIFYKTISYQTFKSPIIYDFRQSGCRRRGRAKLLLSRGAVKRLRFGGSFPFLPCLGSPPSADLRLAADASRALTLAQTLREQATEATTYGNMRGQKTPLLPLFGKWRFSCSDCLDIALEVRIADLEGLPVVLHTLEFDGDETVVSRRFQRLEASRHIDVSMTDD